MALNSQKVAIYMIFVLNLGKKEVSDKAFLKNVCYIKHFYVLLHPIKYNYGKEYIWKDDAKGIEPEPEDHG